MAGRVGGVTFGKRISPVICRNLHARQSYVVSSQNCPRVTYIKGVHILPTTDHTVESWTGSAASKLDGKSEVSLRKVFHEADNNAVAVNGDELELTAPKREKAHGQGGRRMVSQFLSLVDGVKQRPEVLMVASNSISGTEPVNRGFQKLIQYPVEHSEKFLKYGMTPLKGVLLRSPSAPYRNVRRYATLQSSPIERLEYEVRLLEKDVEIQHLKRELVRSRNNLQLMEQKRYYEIYHLRLRIQWKNNRILALTNSLHIRGAIEKLEWDLRGSTKKDETFFYQTKGGKIISGKSRAEVLAILTSEEHHLSDLKLCLEKAVRDFGRKIHLLPHDSSADEIKTYAECLWDNGKFSKIVTSLYDKTRDKYNQDLGGLLFINGSSLDPDEAMVVIAVCLHGELLFCFRHGVSDYTNLRDDDPQPLPQRKDTLRLF